MELSLRIVAVDQQFIFIPYLPLKIVPALPIYLALKGDNFLFVITYAYHFSSSVSFHSSSYRCIRHALVTHTSAPRFNHDPGFFFVRDVSAHNPNFNALWLLNHFQFLFNGWCRSLLENCCCNVRLGFWGELIGLRSSLVLFHICEGFFKSFSLGHGILLIAHGFNGEVLDALVHLPLANLLSDSFNRINYHFETRVK